MCWTQIEEKFLTLNSPVVKASQSMNLENHFILELYFML